MGDGTGPDAAKREVTAEARFSDQGEHVKRRLQPRYGVELDVHFGSEHNFYAGFVENMSVGGLFIATHQLRPLGELFEFSIFLPGTNKPIRGKGEVRWVREYNEGSDTQPGMGIRFYELEGDAEQVIKGFIKRREPMFFDDD